MSEVEKGEERLTVKRLNKTVVLYAAQLLRGLSLSKTVAAPRLSVVCTVPCFTRERKLLGQFTFDAGCRL